MMRVSRFGLSHKSASIMYLKRSLSFVRVFFFSSRRPHTRLVSDWSSDVCSSDLGDDRIAVIATGGLSHEPGGPRYFWVDEEFDRWFLDLLAKGDHETLLAECTLERMEEAGSGGTAELLSWFLVLAMTRGPADVLAYMPAVAWRSGTGMVAWGELAGD